MKRLFPTLFVSHGAPTLLLDDSPAHKFLKELGKHIERPKAIIMISAHWEARQPSITNAIAPTTLHDFRGFPLELYQMRYPAPGHPDLAKRVQKLMQDSGLKADLDNQRGFDHGAWVPLMLMYPDADIPVLQVSLWAKHGTREHFNIGKVLRPVREEGILVIGAGSMTHNLEAINHSTSPPSWVSSFNNWMYEALDQGRIEDLLDYRNQAPNAIENHPSEEHILPLFVSLGAAPDRARRLHHSYTYGVLSMDIYRFDNLDMV